MGISDGRKVRNVVGGCENVRHNQPCGPSALILPTPDYLK
jgi:hypothetical protein